MKVFDEHSFEELLMFCSINTSYHGAIVMPTNLEMHGLAEQLGSRQLIIPIPHVKNIYRCASVEEEREMYRVEFDTGSTIDIQTPLTIHTSNAQYNSIIIHRSIWEHAARANLENHEIGSKYWTDRDCIATKPVTDPMDTETDTSELDNFLSGFAIKPQLSKG